MIKEEYINNTIPHDSAYKHVDGSAEYTDDIIEPEQTLFGAIGWSKKAHAIIKKVNLDEVIKSEGVIAVVASNSSIRVNVGQSRAGGFVAPLEMELTASVLENSNV